MFCQVQERKLTYHTSWDERWVAAADDDDDAAAATAAAVSVQHR